MKPTEIHYSPSYVDFGTYRSFVFCEAVIFYLNKFLYKRNYYLKIYYGHTIKLNMCIN